MKNNILLFMVLLVAVAAGAWAEGSAGFPNMAQPTKIATRTILHGVTFNPTPVNSPTPTPKRPILHGVTLDPTVTPGNSAPVNEDPKTLMAKAQSDKCGSLAGLDSKTSILHKDVPKLADRYKKISSDLNDTANVLSIPSKLVTALDKSIVSLKAIRVGLETAEAVPQLHEKAAKLKKEVQSSLDEAVALKSKAEKISKEVAPAQKVAKEGSKGFGAASHDLTLFDMGILQNEPAATSAIQYSLDYFDDPQRSCIQGKVDPMANDATTLSVELDRAVTLMLYEPDIKGLALFKEIADKLKQAPFDDLLKDVNKLEKRLAKLDAPLKEIEKLLDKSFKVNFGIYKVKISGKTIVKGADAIEDEIRHVLGKLAWAAAKDFGVKKIIHILMSDADKDFKKVIAKLDFSTDVHLPGLGRLDGLDADLSGLVPGIPASLSFPVFNFKKPNFGIPEIDASMDLRRIGSLQLDFCSPYGYDWSKEWNKFKLKPPTLGCSK